jgi:hypothetical protein
MFTAFKRRLTRGLLFTTALTLVACGGGGGGGTTTTTTYTIGGTVSGLPSGASAVLQDNGGDNMTVTANGAFTFATALDGGAAYAVTVSSASTGTTCTLTAPSGSVGTTNVTSVAVTCHATASGFTVGGTLSGLPVGVSVVVQDNGGDGLTLTANGAFTFATALANGAAYAATVSTQPAGATCSVTNGTGSIASANVTNVTVACASTATTGSTAFSALSVGNARIALVPLNLASSLDVNSGVLPAAIDGTTTLTNTGKAYVPTTFQITSCSTDSANLLAICMNYNSTSVAILDLSKFASTFNVGDIKESEFDTGAPTTTFTSSGASCVLCGVVAVPALKSFAVSASDGYRVYAYPAAGATSPLTPSKKYSVAITENFALSSAHSWIISPDYNTNSGARVLRVIDLVSGVAYTWAQFTDNCATSDPAACTSFSGRPVDSATYSDDTNLLTLVDEAGDAELTIDMSQAVFNATAGTFTAPHSYNALPSVGTEMSGILASSVGHWGYFVAEFGDAVVGVEQLPSADGTGGTLTIADPTPIYLDLSTLSAFAPCTTAPVGGTDPHAQGYTVNHAGVPMGLFVSGDSRCVAVINFAVLYAAPRQAAPMSYLADATKFDPIASGAVTFYAIPAE